MLFIYVISRDAIYKDVIYICYIKKRYLYTLFQKKNIYICIKFD